MTTLNRYNEELTMPKKERAPIKTSKMYHETRISLLEQSNQYIIATLKDLQYELKESIGTLKKEMGEFRTEIRQDIKDITARSWTQFIFLMSCMGGILTLIARKNGWL
jgi:hypothetical protein